MIEDPHKRALAQRIGARYARNGMFFGLLSAATILTWTCGWQLTGLFDVIEDVPVQTMICCLIGPVIAHLIGRWAGPRILLLGWNTGYTSLGIGFASVWVTTFLFSLIGFFDEGIHGWQADRAIEDYIFMPLAMVTMYGGLFIILASLVMSTFYVRVRRARFHDRD